MFEYVTALLRRLYLLCNNSAHRIQGLVIYVHRTYWPCIGLIKINNPPRRGLVLDGR